MDDHQLRLWGQMLRAVEDYRVGRKDFPSLVGELQGAMDAGDFRDYSLVKEWYALWTPLETYSALCSEGLLPPASDLEAREKLEADVDAMYRFLERHLPAE